MHNCTIDNGNGYIDLQGVRFYFPKLPDKSEILFSHLPKKEQKWKRHELPTFSPTDIDWFIDEPEDPEYLVTWDDARRQELAKQKGVDIWSLDKQGNPRPIKGIDIDPDYVMPPLEEFRGQELDRFFDGVWIMVNGKPIFLTGHYYKYLQWHKNDNGYPDFYITELHEFYHWESVKQSKVDYGVVKITQRGRGKSAKMGSIAYDETIMNPNAMVTGQGRNDEDAEKFFLEKIAGPYKHYPDFLIPTNSNGTSPTHRLVFSPPSKTGKNAAVYRKEQKEALNSVLDYSKAGEKAVDGRTLRFYFCEEPGKCLGAGTPVRMANGDVKKVEDIIVGDKIMGPNGSIKTVKSLASGIETMYKILPRKFSEYTCNESHIISTVCSAGHLKINGKKYTSGDIINIEIKDYVNLSEYKKRNLMLYRASVDYPEQKHIIPPYFLGLWLGNGDKSRMAVYSMEPEVEKYLVSYADTLDDVHLRIKNDSKSDKLKVYSFSNDKLKNKHAKYLLTDLSLRVKGKHIPKSYMIDSRNNRLELLAGLLDTDGYLCKKNNGNYYEIAQVRKGLAEQIQDLANSLGFYSSLNKKSTSNQFGFKGTAYRVCIYGSDLTEIPTKVKRRKASKVTGVRVKNPLRSGFEVEKIGIGKYFGFTLEDDCGLFLLGDYQVTHNTDPRKVADVFKRHTVNRFCVYRNSRKIGNMMYATTVEDLDVGGFEFKKLWDASNPGKRNKNGQTESGLCKYFISALENTVFDEYGYPVIDNPTPTQRKWIIEKYGEAYADGARPYHENERETAKNSDDPGKYIEYIQKFPFTEDEAFMFNGRECIYNAEVLQTAQVRLTSPDINWTTRGDFVWEEVDKKAKWVPNNVNGKWEVSYLLPDNLQNKVMSYPSYNGTYTHKPLNGHFVAAGFDPISHKVTVDKNRASMAAGAIRLKFNYHVEEEYCNTWCADYLARPSDPEESFEDMIIACFFYGTPVLIENNKNAAIQYFQKRGYDSFVMRRPENTLTTKTKAQITPGVPSSTPMIEFYTSLTATDINKNGHKIKHLRIVQDFLEFDPNNTTKYDSAVAASLSIVASEKPTEEQSDPIEVDTVFTTYDNSGQYSRAN